MSSTLGQRLIEFGRIAQRQRADRTLADIGRGVAADLAFAGGGMRGGQPRTGRNRADDAVR
jgi:hypothetical protein